MTGKKINPDDVYWNTPIKARQYEYECICGHIWIDSENNGCPMCYETVDISVQPYEIKQPNTFNKK